MESLLGFKESNSNGADEQKPQELKLVPWLSWEEWSSVGDSLFSSSPLLVDSALQRISTWRTRGCIPIAINVTASVIEVQQKDPFFRDDIPTSVQLSEEMLAMLYSMAVTRLVNGVIEKHRKKSYASIAEAAEELGLHRMVIDVRHEGSHRGLPSLKYARLASTKALEWLQSNYWKPQKDAIRQDQTTIFQKETRDRLHELACCLKEKANATSSPFPKEKRPKKKVTRSLKNVLRLYSSSSSEVVSVLLEMLVNALDSSQSADGSEYAKTLHGSLHVDAVFDYWKPAITKLSNKASDFLFVLLRGILDKIETLAAMESQIGYFQSFDNGPVSRQIQLLSCMFEWLAVNMNQAASETENSSEDLTLQKATLPTILSKCLMVSSHDNKHLMASSVVIASLIGNIPLRDKLKKLSLLSVFEELDLPNAHPAEIFLSKQEELLRQAAKKFELIKLRSPKGKKVNEIPNSAGPGKRRWVVADSWRQCPIGMLPHAFSSSGRLPVLDYEDSEVSIPDTNSRKRVADSAIECLYNSTRKKTREAETEKEEREQSYDDSEKNVSYLGIKGCLMIGGEWKKVSADELLAIASSVRLLA
ncbi:unnamed protein product [Cuscuta campestris]|uniref:Ribosomal biogenesis protein LAS1L n=1 Tax=Cuscuta campestris TaxID=132261 RepID=A0A484LXX9_9ASTE|nr:unnamed protein product [Cuscuta campestris]